MITETFESNKTFSFDLVSSDTIFKEILSLVIKKAAHSNDVPTKIVKPNADLFSISVSNAFRKKPKLEKTNYQPISLLLNISKVFERCMHRKILEYFETVLSKFQCGFRKGYSTQDCLLAMAENCKKALD